LQDGLLDSYKAADDVLQREENLDLAGGNADEE